jgi:hypothetical protein
MLLVSLSPSVKRVGVRTAEPTFDFASHVCRSVSIRAASLWRVPFDQQRPYTPLEIPLDSSLSASSSLPSSSFNIVNTSSTAEGATGRGAATNSAAAESTGQSAQSLRAYGLLLEARNGTAKTRRTARPSCHALR